MRDDDLDAIFEILAEQERVDTDRLHGEHIVAAVEAASLDKRQAADRFLLDILHQAGQPTEPGDDA